jgi:hypothetical protein
MTYQKTLRAFKEAVADTSVGMLTNIPINFILIAIAFEQEWSAFTTSVFLTVTFTILALFRKTFLRLYFESLNEKNS